MPQDANSEEIPETKTDSAWKELFDRHSILDRVEERGYFEISSSEINQFREARLMTKFDHSKSRPEIFKKNELSIIPNSRGTYLIGRFNAYQSLGQRPNAPVTQLNFPSGFETIDPDNLYSEAAGLLCAYYSGMIHEVAGEEVHFTLNGRMSTGKFDFQINRLDGKSNYSPLKISVKNAQCEIDGGFEGHSKLVVIEAKNIAPMDFHIRQLYYPYRLWRSKIKKDIVPVFLSVSNEIFSFFVFRFADLKNYNSIELAGTQRYRLAPLEIVLDDLLEILRKAEASPAKVRSDIPFPQANSFARIVDLLEAIHTSGPLTPEEIADNYEFDPRQAHYYPTAAIYLGLAERFQDDAGDIRYRLTNQGSKIFSMPSRKKFLALSSCIVQNRVFARAFRLYLANLKPPTNAEIVKIIESEGVPIGESTRRRRAQTVSSWVKWIMQLQNP